jgi:hypothetical protein
MDTTPYFAPGTNQGIIKSGTEIVIPAGYEFTVGAGQLLTFI